MGAMGHVHLHMSDAECVEQARDPIARVWLYSTEHEVGVNKVANERVEYMSATPALYTLGGKCSCDLIVGYGSACYPC